MGECSNPECKQNFEKAIKEHHDSLYAPDGLIDRIDKKIESIRSYLPKLMKKPNWAVWVGTIFAVVIVVGSALISAGYTIYSSEYRFTSKDKMADMRERVTALETENDQLVKDYSELHVIVDKTTDQVKILVGSVSDENQKRKELNDRLERLLTDLEKQHK